MKLFRNSFKLQLFLLILTSHSLCKLLTTTTIKGSDIWKRQNEINNSSFSSGDRGENVQDSSKKSLGKEEGGEINVSKNNFVGSLNLPTRDFVRFNSAPSLCKGSQGSFTGYIDLYPSKSLFFWLFEAKNNPDNAPLILWLGGGPGASSVAGAFTETGPCRMKKDSSGFDTNEESWNENANMLYIDQPVGVGYSYGTVNVTNSYDAIADVYDALQLFLTSQKFSKFSGRPFGLWTESYGGRYGPILVDYILNKNAQISSSLFTGMVSIPVITLGIGNGLTSPLIQYESYISYAKSNPYKKKLVSDTKLENGTLHFFKPGGCRDLVSKCDSKPNILTCFAAQSICDRDILEPLTGEWDPYDIRVHSPSKYPPAVDPILNDAKFKSQIGVSGDFNYAGASLDIFQNFLLAGDIAMSSVSHLEAVINAGVKTLLYSGDADFIVNYQGTEALIPKLNTDITKGFLKDNLVDWVVDGEKAGLYESLGQFSYLRIYGAGHQVPAYGSGKLPPGRASKVFFEQMISGGQLQSPTTTKNSAKRSDATKLQNFAWKILISGIFIQWLII